MTKVPEGAAAKPFSNKFSLSKNAVLFPSIKRG